jgi:hypothetical protein
VISPPPVASKKASVLNRGGAFDYMGDKRADLPLFRAARLALLVRPSKRLLTRAQASCRVGHVFD